MTRRRRWPPGADSPSNPATSCSASAPPCPRSRWPRDDCSTRSWSGSRPPRTAERSVAAFLDCDLDRRRTAQALNVHPNTVDNRLARAAQLTGLDPHTTHGVQLFGAALTLRRLAEGSGHRMGRGQPAVGPLRPGPGSCGEGDDSGIARGKARR
ncbi:helix-turn-helix domain-containing protein [Streptomyces tubercidicus]|uniref:helix-turn-helix domain-containing protein n=1 Tax=Streptomyces tubercidicus TaxID=47759 RepID=UPI001356EFF0